MKISMFVILLLVSFVNGVKAQGNEALRILGKMDSSISATTEMTFSFEKRERCDGEIEYSESFVKYQKTKNLRVFMRSNYPREGLEIFFAVGENDDQVLVNTNTFPYFNLHLDPLGAIIRSEQHHTIYDLGFSTLQNTFRAFRENHADSLSYFIRLEDRLIWEGDSVYKISINYPSFDFVRYTVKKGEDIDKIARKLGVSGYMILENNEDLDDYDDVEEGDVIWVPNNYSLRCELYITYKNYLPVRQLIMDHKGLYEHYQYKKVNVKPMFKRDEFSPEFPGYGF